MNNTITRRLALTGIAAALAAGPLMATAQAFPSKPLTIIVPFSAGGTTDILARIIGDALKDELGQPVVIDNRAGAGGNIGAALAAKAPNDGHTLFMGTVGTHAINTALYKKPGYDHLKDFAPLTRVAMVPNLLVAHPSRPYGTVKELIAFAKANPGKISFGSSGSGSSIHLSGELFKTMTGADMVHIPYKGSAPAVTDLIGGQIDIMFDNMPSAIQHVRSDRLKPIAVTTSKRSPELPNVPTMAEAGVPGYEATSWFGIFAPAGTPAPVVARLNSALVKVLNDPAVKKKITEQGAEPVAEKPEQFAPIHPAGNNQVGQGRQGLRRHRRLSRAQPRWMRTGRRRNGAVLSCRRRSASRLTSILTCTAPRRTSSRVSSASLVGSWTTNPAVARRSRACCNVAFTFASAASHRGAGSTKTRSRSTDRRGMSRMNRLMAVPPFSANVSSQKTWGAAATSALAVAR